MGPWDGRKVVVVGVHKEGLSFVFVSVRTIKRHQHQGGEVREMGPWDGRKWWRSLCELRGRHRQVGKA
jgi:hypothetical protein